MTPLFRATTVFFATLLLGCDGQSGDSIKNRKNDTLINYSKRASLVDTPRSFVRNYGNTDSNRLFAFVGEKLLVEPLPHKRGSMDNGFKAKYAILKKIYGNFPQDTIEFVAYDHYGTPPFSKFKNVLLYVSADSGTYYHQKYMYNDVYKTKGGRWAGTYADGDYKHAYNKHTKIKPVKIDFAERVAYPTRAIIYSGAQVTYSYPKPYFKTVGDSAIAIYGNFVEELFALKKTGILTARRLFEATAEQEEDMVESMQPEAPKTPPSADDLKFLSFWKTFVVSLKEPGLKNFRKIALDSLLICDRIRSTDNFIDKCFGEVIDDEVQKRIIDRTKLEYTSSQVEFADIFTSNARKEIVKVGNKYRFRQMLVTRSTKNSNPPTIDFVFIETKKGYRFYGIDHYWFKECCQ
ncbi:hypothetical protein [Niastella populi]|uniref:Lipoprotein n=1 Tax=Niastella populi TaxID=550983 RepID=A0A1V9GAE1_9BACT|nr:hypothetical protein [Niastella populi]OQP67540.1 hypothetical protein A4R26_33185 [Niastella populi]